MREEDFHRYLERFYDKKQKELAASSQRSVNRIKPVVFDLSTSPASQNGGLPSKLLQVPANFTGLHVEKIYSTSTGVAKTGEIKLILDSNTTLAVQNYKLLQINDSFTLENSEIANAWLDWDLQADTSVRISFFIDMDYRAGSASTSIAGTVGVQSASSTGVAVKASPFTTVQKTSTSGTTSYTIPAGQYAIANFWVDTGSTGTSSVSVNTTEIIGVDSSIGSGVFGGLSNIYLNAGDVIALAVSGGGNPRASGHFALFTI